MKCYLGLTCKVGSYTQVLHELAKLKIPQENITELLYCSIDILIQFGNLGSLNEFVEHWFNPIVKILEGDPLITETLSFIVISSSPPLREEPYAYLFINTNPQNFASVRENLLLTPGILSADTVFGPYDVISAVQAKNGAELDRLLTRIHRNIPGVKVSMTGVVKFRSSPSTTENGAAD
ncbi:MAG: Lrp/AsnC ligand binding domain-containing protein [Candidatus Bathyarchaeota archaeon]|nr:MAG: Lrp/AsnC ligand binding domain-containing protein [Candidatus Bathyarchaeota archaeon]